MQKVAKQPKGMMIIFCLIIFLFSVLVLVSCLRNNAMLSRQSSITTDYDHISPAALTGPLVGGSEIRQEIWVKGDLVEVSVMLGTYDRKNKGKVTISLWDKDIELASKTVLQIQLLDKALSKLTLPEAYSLKEPALLTLKIMTDGSEESNSIGVWSTQSGSTYSQGQMYLNGEPLDADLCFSYKLVDRTIVKGIGFWAWNFGFLLFISLTYWLLWGKLFFAFLKRIYADIKAVPVKWLSGLTMILGAAGLGVLSEYLYGRLIVGGPTSTGAMLNQPRLICFVAVWILLAVFILLRKLVHLKPEKLFVSVMLILGCMFIFITPAEIFFTWDEQIHFSWSLSQSFPDDTYTTWSDDTISAEPMPLTFQLAEAQENAAAFNDYYDDGFTGIVPNVGIDRFITRIGHWPSGLAMALARGLGLNFQWILRLGKLGNLIAYTLIVYFAIRKLRSGKMLLSAIACMPTTFVLATNFSYDYWITAWIMLAFATYFSELQQPEKKLSMHSAILILFSILMACLPKQPYIPIILPLMFIPKSKFTNRKQRIAYLLSIIGIGLLVVATLLIVRMEMVGDGDIRGGDTVSISGQIQYILSNPSAFFTTLLRFLKGYLAFANMGDTLTFFAYLGTNSSASYAACLLTLIAVTDKSEHDLKTCTGSVRMFTWAGTLITVIALASSMYIAFTPVGLDTINGCQSRYLLPLMFPALYLIGSPRIQNKMNHTLYYYMGHAAVAFMLIQAIWDRVASRYN